VDVTSTADAAGGGVVGIKGGTRDNDWFTSALRPCTPQPPTDATKMLSPGIVATPCLSGPPPPLAICFARSPRKQYDVTRPPLLFTVNIMRGSKKKENQTFNNLQRRPTTYARMTNRLRTLVFLPVVLLFQSLYKIHAFCR